jgi:hypothetical protein
LALLGLLARVDLRGSSQSRDGKCDGKEDEGDENAPQQDGEGFHWVRQGWYLPLR